MRNEYFNLYNDRYIYNTFIAIILGATEFVIDEYAADMQYMLPTIFIHNKPRKNLMAYTIFAFSILIKKTISEG